METDTESADGAKTAKPKLNGFLAIENYLVLEDFLSAGAEDPPPDSEGK